MTWLWLSLILTAPSGILGNPPIPNQTPFTTLFVHSESGDDKAKGSEDDPLKTIGEALRRLDQASASITLLGGVFSAASGETFPLRIKPGTRLSGQENALCILRGGPESAVLKILTPSMKHPEPTSFSHFTIQGGKAGVHWEKGVAHFHGKNLDVLDNDLGFDGEQIESGTLTCEGVDWKENRIGLLVTAAGSLSTSIDRCLFEKNKEAGFLARGTVETPTDIPLLVMQGSKLIGNDIGIHLEQPAGDRRISVLSSEFRENIHYGVRCVGKSGESRDHSVVAGCQFHANGIGVYLTNLQIPYSLERCQVMNSVGAGVFLGNFSAQPSSYRVSNCVLTHNGAGGIQILSDGRSLAYSVTECTIVDNQMYGVFVKAKHGGEVKATIRNSIVWNHPQTALGIDVSVFSHCVLGADLKEKAGPSNHFEDPRFVNQESQDYQIDQNSVCLDAGIMTGQEGYVDFAGAPRRVDGDHDGKVVIDIGAFERQN